MVENIVAWEDIPAALNRRPLSVLKGIRKFCEGPTLRKTNLKLDAMYRAARRIEEGADEDPAPGSFLWFSKTVRMLSDAACLVNKVTSGPVSRFSEKESAVLAAVYVFCTPENLRQAQEAVGKLKSKPGARFVFGPAPASQWEEVATFLVGAGCLAAMMWKCMKPKKMV